MEPPLYFPYKLKIIVITQTGKEFQNPSYANETVSTKARQTKTKKKKRERERAR